MTVRIASSTSAQRAAARRPSTIVTACRALVKDLFDPYRPELHYMRGPGPKWREKHSQAHRTTIDRQGEFAPAPA